MGAAEGLSYLTVLGFAGAGLGARVNSGGKQGLKGPLAVPEALAYGALGAGLLVLASQVGVEGCGVVLCTGWFVVPAGEVSAQGCTLTHDARLVRSHKCQPACYP